jgi:ketosteroid isomerase-like protein
MNDDAILSELLERCRQDHQAWINGDGSRYELPEDGTILGAVGGYSQGGAETAERQRALASQWRRGTGTIEYVSGGTDGQLAWLVFVERSTVEFEGDSEGVEHRWDLRVTEVFRKEDGDWYRIHRHADPLVDRRGLADVAGLLT